MIVCKLIDINLSCDINDLSIYVSSQGRVYRPKAYHCANGRYLPYYLIDLKCVASSEFGD